MNVKTAQSEFKQAVFNTLAQIPSGKVLTYGQLAKYSGMPGGARAVGRLLRSLPEGTELPWHRVLNARGEISIPHQGALVQRDRLEAEGIDFLDGKILIENYSWHP